MFVFIKCCYSSKTFTFPQNNVTVTSLVETFKIVEGEEPPILLKVSDPCAKFIGPNEDGHYEQLERDATYNCIYEEGESDDDDVVLDVVKKSIDLTLQQSIEHKLKDFHEVYNYLKNGSMPEYMEGSAMKEKRHYFRRKVRSIKKYDRLIIRQRITSWLRMGSSTMQKRI